MSFDSIQENAMVEFGFRSSHSLDEQKWVLQDGALVGAPGNCCEGLRAEANMVLLNDCSIGMSADIDAAGLKNALEKAQVPPELMGMLPEIAHTFETFNATVNMESPGQVEFFRQQALSPHGPFSAFANSPLGTQFN